MNKLMISTAFAALIAVPAFAQTSTDSTTPPPPATETAPMTTPDAGTSTAPDAGTSTTPDSGTSTAPDAGTSTMPAPGTTAPDATATTPPATTMPAPESSTTPSPMIVAPEGFVVYAGQPLTAEDLTGSTVYDVNGDSISSISDLVIAGDGQITDVILDIGGFLGIGARSVAISYDELEIFGNAEGSEYRIYFLETKEQLEARPEYVKP